MQSLLVLGRQPAIGAAEIESLYGPDKMTILGSGGLILLDVDPCQVNYSRLGGATRFAKVLSSQPFSSWTNVEQFLVTVAPEKSTKMEPGKMYLGISVFGFPVTHQEIIGLGIKLKKAIQKTGRSVRVIPNKSPELNAAQVIHNKLTTPHGWELLIIRHKTEVIIAQTIQVQDIASYAARDQQRPSRDAKVGMLPPKLAQIIVNLGAGPLSESELPAICGPEDQTPLVAKAAPIKKTVLDPFCGTGVLLQEALLMGYTVSGTDIEQRMIDYSSANLSWLQQRYSNQRFEAKISLHRGDATTYTWPQPIDFIATEAYLGRPFTSKPTQELLNQTLHECNTIMKRFLENLAIQTKPGTRYCIAVPAWKQSQDSFVHLPILDSLEVIGYNRVSFKYARDDQLVYYRPEQFVARELVVLERTTKVK